MHHRVSGILQMGVKVSAENDYQKCFTIAVELFRCFGMARPARALVKKESRGNLGRLPLAPTKPMITFTIGDGHDGINEGTINENGIIKISGKDLLRLLGRPCHSAGWPATVRTRASCPCRRPVLRTCPTA